MLPSSSREAAWFFAGGVSSGASGAEEAKKSWRAVGLPLRQSLISLNFSGRVGWGKTKADSRSLAADPHGNEKISRRPADMRCNPIAERKLNDMSTRADECDSVQVFAMFTADLQELHIAKSKLRTAL